MRLLVVLAAFIACALAVADITVQYAGTTTGAPTWNPPSFTGTTCAAGATAYNYVSFTATFPFAGVREVSAMAEKAFKSSIRVYIYQSATFPTAPCTGLAQNQDLVNQFTGGGGGGPVIDDFIYFQAATYTFVVTGATGGIFALHVDPSDGVGTTAAGGPVWTPVDETQSTTSGCSTSSNTAAFGNYTWTQNTTGQFDLYAFFFNETVTGVESYLALYQGTPTVAQLSVNPCNTSATLIGSTYSDYLGLFIPYFNLTAGVTYTLVFSLDEGQYGDWAVRVIPTRIRFFSPVGGYTQPERDTLPCSASSYTGAAWGATSFVSQHSVYVLDTGDVPSNSPFTDVDTYSFLYAGPNGGAPPTTCPVFSPLVLGGDTGDITPLYAFTKTGVNYTAVVSTYTGSAEDSNAAYIFYFYTGTPIGNVPVDTTTSTGGSSTVVVSMVAMLVALMSLL